MYYSTRKQGLFYANAGPIYTTEGKAILQQKGYILTLYNTRIVGHSVVAVFTVSKIRWW